MGPVTFYVTKKLKVNPIPFIMIEIFSSNIGGTATLIGDPPNIMIGSASRSRFFKFHTKSTTNRNYYTYSDNVAYIFKLQKKA